MMFMATFDDQDGVSEGDIQQRHAGPAYDPLFGDWDETPSAGPVSQYDDLFSLAPPDSTETDEYAFTRYDPAALPAPSFPDRFQGEYAERLTELQRRLREETIVLPKERRWIVTVRELAETLLLAALIFLAVRASFQNFRVEGASMEPSLQSGEYLIVNKLTYAELDLSIFNWLPFYESGADPVRHLWNEPERGDVVVFRAPTSPNRDFIKRIIGLPGDTVLIDGSEGTVQVNGKLLDETYIQGRTQCTQSGSPTCTFNVPPADSDAARDACGSDECYFVLGDNRQNSSDSRGGWFVPRENIIGKTLLTYWNEGSPSIGLAPNHSVTFADDEADSGAGGE
jgi:signal peptidase I